MIVISQHLKHMTDHLTTWDLIYLVANFFAVYILFGVVVVRLNQDLFVSILNLLNSSLSDKEEERGGYEVELYITMCIVWPLILFSTNNNNNNN